ncbi:MAG: flagellar FliJ family protein [Sinobacterium sp.]|nr:flagellar FliJ family protein [Sinobacterium sp.]
MNSKIEGLNKVLAQKEQRLLQLEQAAQPFKNAAFAAANKLATLEQYLQDHAAAPLESKTSASSSARSSAGAIQLLLNRQNFIEQIKSAISQQQQLVDHTQMQYDLEEAKCIQQRIACKQIESLIDKKLLEEVAMLKQIEQKQSDEIASQFTQRKR